METLRYYPEYQENLKEKVRKLIKGRQKTDQSSKVQEIDVESIVKPREKPSTPRMVETVMQIVSPDSQISQMFAKSKQSFPSVSTTQTSVTTVEVISREMSVSSEQSLDSDENQQKSESLIDINKSPIDNQFVNDIVCQL